MSEEARRRWDERYGALGRAAPEEAALPAVFRAYEGEFPCRGIALELGCGRGRAALWLAGRGLCVHAVDVSPVAVGLARERVERSGLAERCRVEVFDLDDGLPEGPPVDVLLCHQFRDPRLYGAMIERLAPGGLLAISVLSQVGGRRGRFRAKRGELRSAFRALDHVAHGEADGQAWLLARRPASLGDGAQPTWAG